MESPILIITHHNTRITRHPSEKSPGKTLGFESSARM
jgi:hypothetical protein